MDGTQTWTDCDEAGDYVVPNVLSPRDLVFRPDNMDETVPHNYIYVFRSGRNFNSYEGQSNITEPYLIIFKSSKIDTCLDDIS